MARSLAYLFCVILAVYLSVCSVQAVRVAVAVDFPDGHSVTKCLSVNDSADGYFILNGMGLEVSWGAPGAYGHGLCAINGTGCPSSNCFCNPDTYWNFYIKENMAVLWDYSSVGFDGGDCMTHYCAIDGEVLGFAYGKYGTKPKNYGFSEICPGPTTTIASTTIPLEKDPVGWAVEYTSGNSLTVLALLILGSGFYLLVVKRS